MAVQRYDVEDSDSGEFEQRWWSPVNFPICDSRGELKYLVQRVEEVTEFVKASAARTIGSGESRTRAEILERSAELGRNAATLRAASEAKSEFLSRMSHELRTPLTAINGFSELLALADLPPEQARRAKAIRRAGAHLLDLINEVLEISRIEAGRVAVSIEPISLSLRLDDSIELMRPLAESNNVAIKRTGTAGNVYVCADRQRLKQAFINLISNAVKYNHPGGEVTIDANVDDSGRARVAVIDTGRGIAPENLERVFDPFERLDAATTGVEGTRLGLALTRNLVELMNGEIGVSSEPGHGTTFTVTLETTQPIAVEIPESKPISPVLATIRYDRPVKLLYIEDTIANVTLVEEILKRRPSVKVLPAMQGTIGIDLAVKNRPDFVLLDLHLPDMKGTDVLAGFAAHPELRNMPVTILTADATRAHLEDLKTLGVRDYMTKPIGVEKLLSMVDTVMAEVGAYHPETRPTIGVEAHPANTESADA